ncbi:WD repeat-containing protein 6-like [Argonauta hians]
MTGNPGILSEVFQSGPVTALLIIGDTVLAGIGPYIHIYDLSTSQLLQYSQVLDYNNIHGIQKDYSTSSTSTTTGCLLCAYGEKRINIVTYSDQKITKKHQSRLFQDWIWDVRWLAQTAHCPDRFIAATLGHNVIVLWNSTTDHLLKHVRCQEQCILYSAHFIGVSWDQLLVASGTVFNQVVVWSPVVNTTVDQWGQTVSKPLHYFTGHEGVIFSIDYDPKRQLLCSVSDDRSIRIWKLVFPKKRRHGNVLPKDWRQATGCLVHVLYGHLARVWTARLMESGVISIGEDASCCVWDEEGQIVQKFKGHKGKSIWSLAVNEKETIAVTGGGDCSIRVWNIGNTENSQNYSQTLLKLDNNDSSDMVDFPRSVSFLNFETVLVHANSGYLFLYCLLHHQWRNIGGGVMFHSYSCLAVSRDTQSVAMANLHGYLGLIHLPEGNPSTTHGCHCDTQFVTPEPQQVSEAGKVYSLHWLSSSKILVSEHGGTLSLWKITPSTTQHSTTQPDTTSESPTKQQVATQLSLQKLQQFFLPPCKHRWVTASCFLPGHRMVCGDRSGALYVYCLGPSKGEVTSPEQKFPRLHGKAGVTHVCYHDNYVYTTGRDGHYRQYTVSKYGQLQMVNCHKLSKGFDWFEKLVPAEDLLLYGFHSVNFVIWNCEKSEKLLEIPCGGGHRSWGCILKDQQVHFVYIKVQDIAVCRASLQPALILKECQHGRQILDIKHIASPAMPRSLAVSHHLVVTCSEDTSLQLVHLSHIIQDPKKSPHTNPTTSMKVLATLQAHISSVRCLAVLPSIGSPMHPLITNADAYLVISGGGRAQMSVWRLLVVRPGKDVVKQEGPRRETTASSMTDNCIHEHLFSQFLIKRPEKLWKSEDVTSEPEMRILNLTAFPAHHVDPDMEEGLVFVAAACSDGFIRLFCFDERQDNRNCEPLQLVWKRRCHGGSCILQVTHIIHRYKGGESGDGVRGCDSVGGGGVRGCDSGGGGVRGCDSGSGGVRGCDSGGGGVRGCDSGGGGIKGCDSGCCHDNGEGCGGGDDVSVIIISAATDGQLVFWDITAICLDFLWEEPPPPFSDPDIASSTNPSTISSTPTLLGLVPDLTSSAITPSPLYTPLEPVSETYGVSCLDPDLCDGVGGGGGGGGGGGDGGGGGGGGYDGGIGSRSGRGGGGRVGSSAGGRTGRGVCSSSGGAAGSSFGIRVSSGISGGSSRVSSGISAGSGSSRSGDEGGGKRCLLHKVFAHQSGINSLHLLQLPDSSYLLVSGGDDNALHFMKFHVCQGEDKPSIVCTSSASNFNAHAAQITGVWFVSCNLVVSTSVDQRVCVWRVNFDKKDAEIWHIISHFVTVADISNIHAWQHQNCTFIAVCGTGMSLLTLQ